MLSGIPRFDEQIEAHRVRLFDAIAAVGRGPGGLFELAKLELTSMSEPEVEVVGEERRAYVPNPCNCVTKVGPLDCRVSHRMYTTQYKFTLTWTVTLFSDGRFTTKTLSTSGFVLRVVTHETELLCPLGERFAAEDTSSPDWVLREQHPVFAYGKQLGALSGARPTRVEVHELEDPASAFDEDLAECVQELRTQLGLDADAEPSDDPTDPSEDPPSESETSVSTESLPPLRVAFIVNGGDSSWWFLTGKKLAGGAREVSETLTALGYETYLFSDVREQQGSIPATMRNVLTGLNAVNERLRRAAPNRETELFILLTGHGLKQEPSDEPAIVGSGMQLIAESNGSHPEPDETLLYDVVIRSLVSDWVGPPPTTKLTIWVDACFSGGFFTGGVPVGTENPPDSRSFTRLKARFPHLRVYTSTDTANRAILWSVVTSNAVEDFLQGDGTLIGNLESMWKQGAGWGARKFEQAP